MNYRPMARVATLQRKQNSLTEFQNSLTRDIIKIGSFLGTSKAIVQINIKGNICLRPPLSQPSLVIGTYEQRIVSWYYVFLTSHFVNVFPEKIDNRKNQSSFTGPYKYRKAIYTGKHRRVRGNAPFLYQDSL